MLETQQAGPVRLITLCRPERRNALTPDGLDALLAAIREAERSDARALVLAGRGSVFCAGFDLDLCKAHPDGSVMRALLSGLARAIAALRVSRLPVVIAAHGAAIAGGCALLGGADFVIADEQAKLGYPVLRLGVSPAVSAPYLRDLVGDGPARERLLDTRLITGLDAHRLGLVHELVAHPDQVMPRALALASELAAKPAHALLATRRWMDEVASTLAAGSRASSPRGSGVHHAQAALDVSLALTGGDEERRLLPLAWSKP
jgi:2-(1,2-epoxy-1,2-dihydrophenyl)acetyl-CoA isomerase